MKRHALALALALVLGPLAIVIVGAFLPTAYELSRSASFLATPAEIHPHLEDLHRWAAWSADLRGAERIEYAGRARGADARVSWQTTRGAGAMEIRASDPRRGVWIDRAVEGRRPVKVAILYEPLAEGKTRVVWIERGELGGNPLARYAGLVMESMRAPAVEESLASLSELASSAPPRAPGTPALASELAVPR